MLHTLIIGAGPFGLTLSAHLKKQGVSHLVVGKPMEFWEKNMPEGMFLRSGCDWHLDVANEHTMEAFLKECGLSVTEVEPIALDFYLRYVRWFINQINLPIHPAYVTEVQQKNEGYLVTLDDGKSLEAQNVVVAVGFQYFPFTPPELTQLLPQGYYSHTCHSIDMAAYTRKRVLIVGGRQSAFEWTALLREKGATHVHVSYRHETPKFAEAHWGWVMDVVTTIGEQPTWFRALSPEAKEEYRYRLWAEGRLKLEPWLDDRIHHDNVTLHPRTQVVGAAITSQNSLEVALSSGEKLEVDHVITATGYKVETHQLPFLHPTLLASLQCSNGFPCLDPHFQSNLPGLYFTSFMAGQDFGPFFGFTIAVRTSAQLIAQNLLKSDVLVN